MTSLRYMISSKSVEKINAPWNAERFLYAWNLCIKYVIAIARERG